MQLAHMTWKQAEKAINENTLVVLPLGSIEQHGPSGPLGTDWLVPANLAERMEKEVDCLVLPALPYGICPYHMKFPGTINIGYDALYATITSILNSMMHHGARRFIIMNGHGGNSPAIERACFNVYDRGGVTAQIDWWTLAADLNPEYKGGHGDGQEVSAMLSILPESVDLGSYKKQERLGATDNLPVHYVTSVLFKNVAVKMMRAVEDVTPTGEFGPWESPRASAATGERMLEDCTRFIVDFAKEFAKVKLPKAKKALEF